MPDKNSPDPSIIDNAPVTVELAGDGDALETAYETIGFLADQLAEAEAEIDRLKGLNTVEAVKARILEPYVKSVFRFVLWYCVVVGIFLVFAAFKLWGFGLSDTILAIIAGSTAVSVIGLIGLVISGLFGKNT